MTEPVERVFRRESGRALATVARLVGDLQLAEDAVQDAFVDALRTWPEGGLPANPGAWITTAARNRALDRVRRESRRADKEEHAALGPQEEVTEVQPIADDELRLVFTCCHPALAVESQVALTLRLVCGLTVRELARAFLQRESTVAQRLSRAKAKIRTAGIPFRLPPEHLLPERLPPVLACVYLVFTEGYAATEGDELIRAELCTEAIRLARTLHALMPDEPEAGALLALLLLQHSRRSARTADGIVPLEEQDRDDWDRAAIVEGVDLLRAAARRGRQGFRPYVAQAAIAAAHAMAPSFAETDWEAIVSAYDDLLAYGDSPVVRLNRAVAVGFLRGFDAGLAEVAATADHPRLRGSHLLPATRADLLRRAGRSREAAQDYRAAVDLATNAQVREFLRRRLGEVEG